jgi:hypothetical protein
MQARLAAVTFLTAAIHRTRLESRSRSATNALAPFNRQTRSVVMFKEAMVSIAAATLVLLCAQANAATPSGAGGLNSELAARRLVSQETAQVRSLEQLGEHLRNAGDRSPLAALSPAARMRFIDSLAFNGNGLTQYRYDVLRRELTASQSYSIMKLFGVEDSATFLRSSRVKSDLDAVIASLRMFQDHDGAKCVSPGTCEKHWESYICTSNC